MPRKYFLSENRDLTDLSKISTSRKLFHLYPFTDEGGLLRVGGWLKNDTSLDIYQRHPIVLPAD